MGAFLAKQFSGTTGSKTVNWCGSFNDSRVLRQKLGAPEGFASCALVGSGGILTRERLGERIDSAELVMRFNLAKLQGFEPIVGKRTSLRELNSESIGFILTEHHDDILAGGETLRRFRNASWCPSYPVFLNSHNAIHQNAFRAVCSEVTTIIDATVFDEHNAVLESLGPLGYNLMSGQLGLALATMLCPTGVDVYGFTHDGSTKITQHRRMPYHYYDPNATLNPLDSLSASAHLLSVFGAAHPSCVRLWTPSEYALSPPFKGNASRESTGDIFIDQIRSESEAGKAPEDYGEEGLRKSMCVPGSPVNALDECRSWLEKAEGWLEEAILDFPTMGAILGKQLSGTTGSKTVNGFTRQPIAAPLSYWLFWGAILLGVCAFAISLLYGMKMWRKREAAARHKTTENSGLLEGRGSAG